MKYRSEMLSDVLYTANLIPESGTDKQSVWSTSVEYSRKYNNKCILNLVFLKHIWTKIILKIVFLFIRHGMTRIFYVDIMLDTV